VISPQSLGYTLYLSLGYTAMAVSVELIYQGLLLSSVFLFAISLPKILLNTAWSFYRTYVYAHLLTGKAASANFSKELIDLTTGPENQYSILVQEAARIVTELKRPGVEMFSALFFMWFSSTQLDVESGANSLLWLFMLAMIIVGLLAFGHFALIAFKLKKLKGGVFA